MRDDVKLPPIGRAFQNKVVASRDVESEMPINKPAPPPDAGLTSMTPIASRTMSGNQTRDWPAPKPGLTYYGKGPR
jgi:hypothetical protein